MLSMMNQTNRKPNYKKTTIAAHKLLAQSQINTFPLSIFDVFDKLETVKVFSFKQMAKMLGVSEEIVSKDMALSDEGAIGTFGNNRIIILYNSDTDTKQASRIRFTLAHELGHLILGHPFETKNAVLSRHGITDKENRVFEVEANHFAREFLAPTFLVNSVEPLEVNTISKCFGISKEPSKYAINWVNKSRTEKGYYLNNLQIPRPYTKFFKKLNFIERISNFNKVGLCIGDDGWTLETRFLRYCNKCKSLASYISNETVLYCSTCCSSDIKIINSDNYFEFHEKEEQNSMAYTELKVDEEGRVLNCPVCDNDHVSENYCSVCGVYIINKCSGKNFIEVEYNEYQWSITDEGPCENKILTGSDRYCPSCGSGSTFFINSLLNEWDIKEEKKSNPNEDPFANMSPINIPDQDLPF